MTEIATAGGAGLAISDRIASAVTDRGLVSTALVYAGVLDDAGQRTRAAPLFLAQVHAMVALAIEESCDLVLTVPGFLRESLREMSREHGGPGLPLDTGLTIRAVASSASTRLVIASPFLHESFVAALAPALTTLLSRGGNAVVITRALSGPASRRSDSNVRAVAYLQTAVGASSGRLRICSWDESGLGIHFKVVMADEGLAYVGSANLTPGGTSGHAEAGVLLRGTQVRALSRWLHVVGEELTRRSVT
ncbi:phospholipase D-like domain-containing protein [Streptomyces sp. NPDC090053]|uniref:phospholipase D-like domain-containing protein n=1 Tax=Streptomyces sp. NPDC090053 TaxID=3365932 RepID=UPI003802A721